MIDVHILTLPETDSEWLDRCLASLECECVKIHICDGVKGDTGAARTTAFGKGEYEFVSFVDPDDEVIPGTFDKLERLLDDESCVMAYSDEVLIDKFGMPVCFGWSINPFRFSTHDIRVHNVNGEYVHHLRVMRRDAVEKCLPLKSKMMPEPILMHELSKYGKFAHLHEVGYKWRIHDRNTFLSYDKAGFEETLRIIGGL